MRPTLLNFRSPKESTPFGFDSKYTYDGRLLSFNSPKGSGKTSTFTNEKRFLWYQRMPGTGLHVGPGSYSPRCSRHGKERIISGSPYRKLHASKIDSNQGHFMVGNQIVFEPTSDIFRYSKTAYESDFKPKKKSDFNFTKDYYDKKVSNLKYISPYYHRKFTPDPVNTIKLDKLKLTHLSPGKSNLTKNAKFFKLRKILKSLSKRFKQ
jgi:hypothetical protein